MARKRFRYNLQAALDLALAQQQRVQAQLAQLKTAITAQAAKIEQLKAQIDQTTQQIRQEHDHLSKAESAHDLAQRNAFLGQLRRRADDQAQQLRQQENHLGFLQVQEMEKQQELVEKITAVKTQEKAQGKSPSSPPSPASQDRRGRP